MKKLSINIGVVLLLLLATNANIFSQKAFKHSLDSIVSERSKYFYSYDEHENNTSVASYYWNDENSSWIGDYKYDYAYDNNCNKTMQMLYNWDYETNNWKLATKYEFTFDNNSNPTSKSHYVWDNTSNDWIGISKNEYAYDSNGKQASEILSLWGYNNPIDDWRKIDKNESTYDDEGNVIMRIRYRWYGAWIEDSKDDFEYDDNGNQTLYIVYDWNQMTNVWEGLYRNEYAYDDSDRETMNAWYYWQDGWIGDSKREFTFDSHGYKILYIYYEWDYATNDWKEHSKSKSEYIYNENETIGGSYDWDYENNTWIEDDYKIKEETTYDENNNQTMYAHYVWNHTTNSWKGTSKMEYSDDGNGRKLNTGYYWEDTTNDWRIVSKSEKIFDMSYYTTDLIVPIFLYYNSWREHAYVYNHENMLTKEVFYRQTGTSWVQDGLVTWYWSSTDRETGISKITNSNLISVYPNPTSGQITIKGQSASANYEIYNLSGQLQKRGKLQGETTIINIESLANGMYILRVAGETVKIIKGK